MIACGAIGLLAGLILGCLALAFLASLAAIIRQERQFGTREVFVATSMYGFGCASLYAPRFLPSAEDVVPCAGVYWPVLAAVAVVIVLVPTFHLARLATRKIGGQ